MIRVERHPWGRRLYVAGRRVHHGPLYALLAAASYRRSHRAGWIFLLVSLTDARDFPFRDTDNHRPRRGLEK